MATGYAGMQQFAPAIYADYLQNLDKVSQVMASTGWYGLFYSPEIQGYYIPDDAHYMRMTQIAVFSPVMIHNEWMGGELPWTRPEPVYQNYLKYVRLHYRLVPYLYSYIWQQHRNGVSAIRSLPLEFQEDKETHNIGTQYMYGRDLMVAPVWDKESGFAKRDIYFPKGHTWYDYETGEAFEGGTWLRDKSFPLDKLPLYVRGGAIIPTMEVPDYIGQKPLTELTLDIYPEGKSSFVLYEDDGESFDYEEGKYCLTKINCEQQKDRIKISITPREGRYPDMPESRTHIIRLHQRTGTGIENLWVNMQRKGYTYKEGIILFSVTEEHDRNIEIEIEWEKKE
jgi:alpha-glucosidase (family GH31 glycosyl hydrolase)